MGTLSRLLGLGGARRDLVADLTEAFRGEAEQASQLRQQAERARYPQVADTLRRLAEAEERHAAWVRDRLLALGGDVPPLAPPPLPGKNQWERAGAALLRRIEDEDRDELPVYEHVLMRSDPQAID